MNISEIEEELISAIYEVQKASGEDEININKHTCPFDLPDFDSYRFCETLINTQFREIKLSKLSKNITTKSTIKDIAQEIQNQLANNKERVK